MKPRNTLILLALALALGAFVYFYEIGGQADREAAEGEEKRLFSNIESEDVESIALVANDGTAVRAERAEAGWRIVEPVDFPADEFAWDGVANVLAELQSESSIESPQPLAEYGLDDASRAVRFRVNGSEHTLLVGNAAPLGSNSYAKTGDSERVLTVPTFRVENLRKDFDALRDKRILRFDENAIERITVSWPEGRVVLERDAASSEGDAGARGGGHSWKLTEPISADADATTVDDLLSNLSFLRADGFEDAPPSDEESGLAAPAFAVELVAEAAEEGALRVTHRFAVGSPQEGGQRLVRGAETSLYRIPQTKLDDFPRSLVAYRFKQLAEFTTSDAHRIELVLRSKAGESVALTLRRGADGWRASPEPFDPVKVFPMLAELSRLRASDILADRMGEAERAALGLAPPNASIKVFGEAEGTDDSAAPQIAEVHLGAVQARGIAVQRAGVENVFLLDAALAEHIPVGLDAFRNRFLAQAAEDDAAPEDADVIELDEGDFTLDPSVLTGDDELP